MIRESHCRNLLCIVLTFFLLNPLIQAEDSKDLFKIWPYTLRTDKGEVLLKFRLNKNKKLVLKIKRETQEGEDLKERILKVSKKKVYTFKLGTQKCGESLEYKLVSHDDPEVILESHYLKAFSCGDGRTSFKFLMMSDTQENNERHQKLGEMISKKMKKQKISFVLNTGDVVQNGGKDDDWVSFFKAGKSYLSKYPIVAALGNHAFYRERGKKTSMPNNFSRYLRWLESPKLGYFSLEFPNFALVIFNSNFAKLKKEQEKNQWKWFEERLKHYKEKELPTFVAMHYPPFSSSAFNLSSSARTLRKMMLPLIEKYGVKIVFSGHTHIYERSFKDNIHYIIGGPSGGKFIRSTYSKNEFKKFMLPNTPTFTLVSVKKDYVSLKTYNAEGKLIDALRVDLK
ncbi:MAG: hypothetical protein CME68_03365 [Halobacteriovoraceae bacterium]|nr:hypothetical protein [Halobacteriovoraceae bacterium]